MATPSDISQYRDELKALAENIPFRQVELAEIEDLKFEVVCIRQERTYVRLDSNMQAIGRFLMERGTVEILKPDMTLALFREIHHCAFRLRTLAGKSYRTTATAHKAVMEGRRLISEMEAAEEELFIANRRLVVRCVKPFVWIGQVWLSDFLQEGSKALSNAIRKFDFTRGTPFYAYAQKAIQNRLRNYFRDHVRAGSIGIRPSRDMVRIQNVSDAWLKIHGKEPDAEALARMTGLTKARVSQLRAFQRQYEKVPAPPVSLDALLGDSTASLHDLVEDDDAAVASDRAQVAEIWTAMEQLPERSMRIMKLRFIEGRTLEETGILLDLTRARIKQIQDDSVRKLREILREGIHKRD